MASVWVAASAGTGKTKVLADRVLRLLLAGTAPNRILALTFTKAAAAEMANRIADVLGQWSAESDTALAADLADLLGTAPDTATRTRARALFARVLETPGGMHIQTIHAFCQSLLGRFPLEAGVAPHFAVMDERDALEMLTAAREEILARARTSSDGRLAAALASVTTHIHESAFADLMDALTAARGRLRRLIDRHGSVDGAVAAVRRALGLAASDTPTTVVAAACAERAFDARALKRAARVLADGSKTDGERGATIARWIAGTPDERANDFPSYVEAFLTNLDKGQSKIRDRLITKDAAAKAPDALAALTAEAERLLAVERRRRRATTADATAGLLVLADALLESYAHHKRQRALLDYDDLILTAQRLLGAPGGASWVLYKLDGGIDHILIDEAQDTNPDQWHVIATLASEFFAGEGRHDAVSPTPRTVFAVGDGKQSIFSFQGADPAAFQTMREWFAKRVQDAGGAWQPVDLTVSFRSVRAVLEAVDAVFAQDAAHDGVALDGTPIVHSAFRTGQAGRVEVWPPVEPRPTDAPPPWKPPVERVPGDSPQARLARLIALRIKRMIDDREILESRGRPIHAGDIMVLVRRRTAFVDDLVRALKELRVEVAGVDRLVLTEHLAVMDLIALGRFLLLPEDDLTLATVLKGPLVGLSEEQLFRLAHRRPGTLWNSLKRQAEHEAPFAAALGYLTDLLGRADFTPPFELYSHVLGPRRGREKLLARLGPDADDPISVFLDLALAFERAHPPSLQSFLHWLEVGALEVKRDLEQSRRDAVRILTVHGAKGLQAPIVFLPDTLQVPTRSETLLWPGTDDGEILLWPPARAAYDELAEAERTRANARRDQEYRRLLYVAMTRAEDRLYVCGWHTQKTAPDGNWYTLIKAGLAGRAEAIDDPFLAAAGETDGATVLRLACPQESSPEGEAKPAEIVVPPAALPQWAREPPTPEPTPPRVLAPSRPPEDEPPVRAPLGPDDGARFRRGTLIHRLLQTLPEVPPEKRADAARRWLAHAARDVPEETRADIAAETLRVLAEPSFVPLFGPGSRAEVPLSGAIDGVLIAAQIDRLVVTPDAVLVVDYKTNRPPPETEDQVAGLYRRQMALYRALLRSIFPGRTIRCALLWTDGPKLMPLSDTRLDRFDSRASGGSLDAPGAPS
jgi:ATP-dependent helicase/nuclease subunit A